MILTACRFCILVASVWNELTEILTLVFPPWSTAAAASHSGAPRMRAPSLPAAMCSETIGPNCNGPGRRIGQDRQQDDEPEELIDHHSDRTQRSPPLLRKSSLPPLHSNRGSIRTEVSLYYPTTLHLKNGRTKKKKITREKKMTSAYASRLLRSHGEMCEVLGRNLK